MTVRAIIWDFGDTLCDQTWMLRPWAGDPRWPVVYQEVLAADGLVERWNTGEAHTAEVATAVARRLGRDPAEVEAHMRACCHEIRFYPRVMRLAAECPLPRAIATVNTDIFSEEVVPAYGLGDRFGVIVTSWEEGVVDKARLCDIARGRLGSSLERSECLLIDNLAENVAAWQAIGGAGLHFTGEESLVAGWRW